MIAQTWVAVECLVNRAWIFLEHRRLVKLNIFSSSEWLRRWSADASTLNKASEAAKFSSRPDMEIVVRWSLYEAEVGAERIPFCSASADKRGVPTYRQFAGDGQAALGQRADVNGYGEGKQIVEWILGMVKRNVAAVVSSV